MSVASTNQGSTATSVFRTEVGIRSLPDAGPEPALDGQVRQMPEGDGRLRWVLAIAVVSIIVGGTADLIMDRPATWLSFHVVFETLMIAGALVMATTLWLGWWRSAHSEVELRATLAAQQEERETWRKSAEAALEGLGHAIDAQFRQWHLTPAESEIALMLLKGYGHKEIAALTKRSERTVRQHAGVVYEKAGIAGRAELAAFFLNGLMLPAADRDATA